MSQVDIISKDAGPCLHCSGKKTAVVTIKSRTIQICVSCEKMWHPNSDGITSKTVPLISCCDDCAFKKGSPERSDPYRWMRMLERFEAGTEFWCHKDVPTAPDGYGYRLTKSGKPDARVHRLCRGWLNWQQSHAVQNT